MYEDKTTIVNESKQTFIYIFLILVLVLMAMPFITTFNDLLTRAVMSLKAYRLIQDFIVPWEVRMVGVILYPLGFNPAILGDYLAIGGPSTGSLQAGGQAGQVPFLVEITWNCIGWQSLVFFLLTAWVGLQGNRYTGGSKLKAWTIGFLGTFLVNIFRIAVVALIAYYFGQNVAIIFHDYGSTLAVIGWLFIFWWFSYSYVLEESKKDAREVNIKV